MKRNGWILLDVFNLIIKLFLNRWYVEPTEAMKQKAKAETEANLDKTSHANTNTKSSSTIPHSNSVTSSLRSPPEPSSTVSTNIARVRQ